MKTFSKSCAQGDVLFIRKDCLPENLKNVEPKNNVIVITHSETGHDHVMVLDRTTNEDLPAVEMFESDNPLVAWIKVNRPTVLEHKRSFDTHEPILFNEGVYQVRRQREHTPEGFRKVQD